MNPLELEMYHQIKNVIRVNPSSYEYLFMVVNTTGSFICEPSHFCVRFFVFQIEGC